ncbi:MAG: hypothetical protein ACRETR_11360 [Steroidobacteraceae bacterium]
MPTKFHVLRGSSPAALLLLPLIALLAQPGGASAAENPVSGGPRQLLISYRSQPADRPAFRAYLQGHEAALLQRLVRQGVLSSYQILFNPFVQPRTWDAMVVLGFNRFSDTRRWLDIEQRSPGGLDARGLKLARPVAEYSADLIWQGDAPDAGSSRGHIFYVIPYTYLSSVGQYKSYVDGYVIPQLQGWLKAGVLSRYRLYLNRYPVGDPEPWDALFVYEYRSLEDFGRRDEAMAAVRQTLRSDPNWTKLSQTKSGLRTESENTIAEALTGY